MEKLRRPSGGRKTRGMIWNGTGMRKGRSPSDARDVDEIRRRLATGEEELIPAEIVDRIIDGENKLRVWRKYRGMSAKELAEATGLAAPYISQLETGKREETIETFKKIAAALRVDID